MSVFYASVFFNEVIVSIALVMGNVRQNESSGLTVKTTKSYKGEFLLAYERSDRFTQYFLTD